MNDGKYRAQAKQWEIGEASTGTPQIGVCFALLDHPGEEITWYGFLSDAALKVTIKALRTCGWTGSDLDDLSGLDANEVSLVLVAEEYPAGSGTFATKVKWVNSVGGLAMGKTLDADAKKAFAAKMKAKILAVDPSSAARHATSKTPEKAGGPDDAPF